MYVWTCASARYRIYVSVFSTEMILLPVPRDMWQYLDTFLLVMTRGRCYWNGVAGGQWGCQTSQSAQDSPPATKSCLTPNVNNAEVENPGSRTVSAPFSFWNADFYSMYLLKYTCKSPVTTPSATWILPWWCRVLVHIFSVALCVDLL